MSAPSSQKLAAEISLDQLGLFARAKSILQRRESWALFDQSIVSATNFVTNVLVGNYCLPSEFGVYYLAISLLYFLRGVQEQLISAPYTIFWHRVDESDRAKLVGSTVAHQVTLMTIGLVALASLTYRLQADDSSSKLVAALHVLLIVLPFFLFKEFIRKLLFAHFQFRAAVVLDLAFSATQLLLIVGLIWADAFTIERAFVCVALAGVCAAVLWYASFRMPVAFERQAIKADWEHNWSFGRWALATHLIGCSTPFLMPWWIKYHSSERVTGLYAACQTLVGLGNMLLAGVSNYLSPKSARGYTDGGAPRLFRILLEAATLFLVTFVPFCALLAWTGDLFPVFFFGDQYSGLGTPLLYLALSLLASALGMTAGNGIWALEKPALNLLADIPCLLLTFGLGALWIGPNGARGAAAAVLVGATAAAAIRWAVLILWLEFWTLPATKGGSK